MKLALALEYSLGHATHAENLKSVLEGYSGIQPWYIDLPYDGMPEPWAKLPGIRSNWSLRASMGAYLRLRPSAHTCAAAFFHTQVTSLLSAGLMRRLPSVISLDATPRQYDEFGALYGHAPSCTAVEGLKSRLNRRAFGAARHLVTWSEWAKGSLMRDYGVPAEKVTVIPPGIDLPRWSDGRHAPTIRDPVKLLFVGGDFLRKGGAVLLAALLQLPATVKAHLHIVTRSETMAEETAGVTVHYGLTPNSPALRRLYAEADLFVFPTMADCLGIAVMEAMAAGLAVITTRVGALPEVVRHGETGWVVPVNDPQALADAIALLATDARLRTRLGAAARVAATDRFDAARNYRELLATIQSVARE